MSQFKHNLVNRYTLVCDEPEPGHHLHGLWTSDRTSSWTDCTSIQWNVASAQTKIQPVTETQTFTPTVKQK